MTTGQITTTLGKKVALNRMWKSTPDYTAPSQFKIGTGTTTPAVGDTDLVTPQIISGGDYLKDVDTTYPQINETTLVATTNMTLLSTDANGLSITELGLFNSDTSPLLITRAVFTAITKTASVQVNITEYDLVA